MFIPWLLCSDISCTSFRLLLAQKSGPRAFRPMSWVHYASPSEEVGSRFRLLIILSVLSTVAAIVVIISRFAKRWPKYGSDDYWALFSLVRYIRRINDICAMLIWIVVSQYYLQCFHHRWFVFPLGCRTRQGTDFSETRYGLGLPLAMRPPEDLYMYRTVSPGCILILITAD